VPAAAATTPAKPTKTPALAKTVRQFRAANRACAAHSRTSTPFHYSLTTSARIIANGDYFAANNTPIEAQS